MRKTIPGMGEVEVAIIINGKPVEEYPHQGETFIWAKYGTKYGIEVRNHTSRRIEAYITVDGLSIIDGKVGNYVTGGGYVIGAYDKVLIPGFMIDGSTAAEFFFSRPGESYAAQMDKPSNVGVIGVAIFSEREVRPMIPMPVILNAVPEMRTMGGPASYGGSAGTGFGSEVDFKTKEVDFKRRNQNTPDATFALRYETRETLEKMGVSLKKKRPVAVAKPDPFPGNSGVGCEPPPGWKRRRG